MHKSGNKRFLQIRCVAKIYDMYHRSVEASVQREKKLKTTSGFLPVTSTEITLTEEDDEEPQTIVIDYQSNWFEDMTNNCNKYRKLPFSLFL